MGQERIQYQMKNDYDWVWHDTDQLDKSAIHAMIHGRQKIGYYQPTIRYKSLYYMYVQILQNPKLLRIKNDNLDGNIDINHLLSLMKDRVKSLSKKRSNKKYQLKQKKKKKQKEWKTLVTNIDFMLDKYHHYLSEYDDVLYEIKLLDNDDITGDMEDIKPIHQDELKFITP